MSDEIKLPSPVEPARVDAWILARLKVKGPQRRAKLERDLPKELTGQSAFLAIEASLVRLQNAGSVRCHRQMWELAPGVKP